MVLGTVLIKSFTLKFRKFKVYEFFVTYLEQD